MKVSCIQNKLTINDGFYLFDVDVVQDISLWNVDNRLTCVCALIIESNAVEDKLAGFRIYSGIAVSST